MSTDDGVYQKPRLDWYQTEQQVVINVLVRSLTKDDVVITIDKHRVFFEAKPSDGKKYLTEIDLCHRIEPEQSSFKILSSKVEIKLRKCEGIQWTKLEMSPNEIQSLNAANYPSSNPNKKDWDQIVGEIKKEEAVEQLEGDAALNQLFQKIYSDGSDETRKAMNKSFLESGGTVLSTNWNEVGTKKIEVNAPDGLQYKKWNE